MSHDTPRGQWWMVTFLFLVLSSLFHHNKSDCVTFSGLSELFRWKNLGTSLFGWTTRTSSICYLWERCHESTLLLISGARAKSVGNQKLITPNVWHAGCDLEREIILLLFILKHFTNQKPTAWSPCNRCMKVQNPCRTWKCIFNLWNLTLPSFVICICKTGRGVVRDPMIHFYRPESI